MCDRTREEILARELCIHYFLGLRSVAEQPNNPSETSTVREYTERCWGLWKKEAQQLLKTLEEH